MDDSRSEPRPVYYGGQAVIEGVMIRGPEHMAVAVRHPRGHIISHTERLSSIYTGSPRSIPVVRGIVVLWETIALGMRALAFSSRVALESEEADSEDEGESVDFPETIFWGSIAVTLVLVGALFFAAPILLSHTLKIFDVPHVVVVLVEGLLRLGILVAYIWAISLAPDIRRVYQYHGAEHMTIHAWEAGARLTIDDVRRFPKEHQRCGTSFLLVVVIVSLITFVIFDTAFDEGIIVRVASRVLLVAPIAAVSYEILRLGARYNRFGFVRLLFKPNIGLQAITTRVPADDQIEVAIASFRAVLDASGIPEPGGAVSEQMAVGD